MWACSLFFYSEDSASKSTLRALFSNSIRLRARQRKLRALPFAIFDQMEPPRPEMDVKWNSETHL